MYKNIDISKYKPNTQTDILVDLRDEFSYNCGTLPGAVNIPLENIGALYDLPKDKRICVFCKYGEFSPQAAELLDDAGYDTVHLNGGYMKYLKDITLSQTKDLRRFK